MQLVIINIGNFAMNFRNIFSGSVHSYFVVNFLQGNDLKCLHKIFFYTSADSTSWTFLILIFPFCFYLFYYFSFIILLPSFLTLCTFLSVSLNFSFFLFFSRTKITRNNTLSKAYATSVPLFLKTSHLKFIINRKFAVAKKWQYGILGGSFFFQLHWFTFQYSNTYLLTFFFQFLHLCMYKLIFCSLLELCNFVYRNWSI